jgi:hypothetical protein
LVADVVLTEFPDYELFCAFKVFNLSAERRRSETVLGPEMMAHLKRLSQAFKVPIAGLTEQFLRIRSGQGCATNSHGKKRLGHANATLRPKRRGM